MYLKLHISSAYVRLHHIDSCQSLVKFLATSVGNFKYIQCCRRDDSLHKIFWQWWVTNHFNTLCDFSIAFNSVKISENITGHFFLYFHKPDLYIKSKLKLLTCQSRLNYFKKYSQVFYGMSPYIFEYPFNSMKLAYKIYLAQSQIATYFNTVHKSWLTFKLRL